jgi:hypothetical protein
MFDEITWRRREREIDRLTTRIRQLNELLTYNWPYYDPGRATDLKKQIRRHQAKLDSLVGTSRRLNWISLVAARTTASRTATTRQITQPGKR